MLWSTGSLKPTIEDIDKYVIRQHAVCWRDIALELELEYKKIRDIGNNFDDCERCFSEVAKTWLESSNDTTWRVLEIAIINGKRLKDGLKTIKDLDGKNLQLFINRVFKVNW